MALVDEWIEKAEGDYHVAIAANRLRKRPEPDGVCFHCQQCAEKYMKAYLIAQGVTSQRTHDLEELLNECSVHDALLSAQMPAATALNQYAIRVRYPGISTTVDEANEALKALRGLRNLFRRKLGL